MALDASDAVVCPLVLIRVVNERKIREGARRRERVRRRERGSGNRAGLSHRRPLARLRRALR
jgi:hypothetical protein